MNAAPTRPGYDRPTWEEREAERADFVGHILALCAKNKGAQADLRSGAGKPLEECGRLHPHVARHIPRRVQEASRGAAFWTGEERAWYAVAALIAARPRAARDAEADAASSHGDQAEDSAAEHSGRSPGTGTGAQDEKPPPRPDLGVSIAATVNARGLAPRTAEAILHTLTRQRFDLLARRLPQVTRQIHAAGQSVDWIRLLADLARWDDDRRRISARWMQSYYRTVTRTAEATDPVDTPRSPE